MPKINPPQIIVIVGPTASGKSDFAIKLARKLNGEIISADSRQVYRGMDIGTGKVSRDRTKIIDYRLSKSKIKNLKSKIYYSEGVRHYLLDVANPKKQFTADDFKKLGEKAISGIIAKKKIPIIVGGTGFYIDILLDRMAVAQVPPNKKLRAKLEKQSAEQLFKQLLALDPKRAETIDRHNRRRLIRALEIITTTGKSVLDSRFKILDSRFKILWLGINPGKEKLAQNIKKRLDARLKQGMVEEVEKLHKQGLSWKRHDDFGLEYRQISRYLQETRNKKQGTSKNFKKSLYYDILLQEIIRYSKRQMTWFKRNKEIRWINNKKNRRAVSLAVHELSFRI